MLQIKQYARVSSLDEAYELNQKKNNVIIGGMHWLKMSTKAVGTAIDLSGLGLDSIIETELFSSDDHHRLGVSRSCRSGRCCDRRRCHGRFPCERLLLLGRYQLRRDEDAGRLQAPVSGYACDRYRCHHQRPDRIPARIIFPNLRMFRCAEI